MGLVAPAILFWLLPLGGVIILLYLLKMRRKNVSVPATFLWPNKVEEIRANALFQRLRLSWLLILQLLALALVVLAWTRPQTMQRGLGGKVTVLVIDSSASMGATDVKPSRFEQARQLALGAVGSARTGDRIAIVEASPLPRVLSSLSSDPTRLRKALDGLELTDAEADVGGALRLAASLVSSESSAKIVLLSDGVFEKVQNFAPGKASVVYQTVGSRGDNLAVTALGVADSPSGRQLFTGVRNFGPSTAAASITVFADGKVIDSEKLSVKAEGRWGKTIVVAASAKLFEARLESTQDILQADNRMVALGTKGSSLRVLLVTRGNYFLERALALDPRVMLDRTEAVGDDRAAAYDVVVFDGVQEVEVEAAAVLTLGAAGNSSPVVRLGPAQPTAVTSVLKHQLLTGVDLRNVSMASAETVRAKPTSDVLASSNVGPIVAVSRTGKPQIYVAFEPMRSDFPLQVGFPIFIANALDFLGGERDSGLLAVRAGAPFSVTTKVDATLERNNWQSKPMQPIGGSVTVRHANRVGTYRLKMGSAVKVVHTTLRSDVESNVMPQNTLAVGSGDVAATKSPIRFADFWRPLLLIALCVFAAEWWLFARRS